MPEHPVHAAPRHDRHLDLAVRAVARRPLLLGGLAVAVAIITPGRTVAQGKIVILREIVDVIGAAAESLAKVAVSFEKAVAAGVRTYDLFAARNAEERLFELRARTGHLVAAQQVVVFDNISDYLTDPTPDTWKLVQDKLTTIFAEVTGVLSDLREEDSAFVATDAYQAMVVALHSRSSLIVKLRSLPPPTEPEELDVLREARDRYGNLIQNLRRANDALAAYLRENSD